MMADFSLAHSSVAEFDRKVCVSLLRDYYLSQNRTITPDYEHYGINELKKCLVMFRIPYVEPILSPESTTKSSLKNGSRNKRKTT
jgi:hypothetical protein